MRLLLFFISLSITSFNWAQQYDELHFGSDTTLDVASWNLERFPKGAYALDDVREILELYNFDIIAVQEVEDTNKFKQLVEDLTGYEGYFKSGYFAGLAFIYKKNVIRLDDVYEIYTESKYWNAFPRSPMVMEFRYGGVPFTIINNHFKCCGDGVLDESDDKDEENRRLLASKLLKDYIDFQKPKEKVMIIGDLNDELMDIAEHNVFQGFIDDGDDFKFSDWEIAQDEGLNWSYPSWPSHIDHILLTNEIFNNDSISIIKTKCLPVDHIYSDWTEYDNRVSDHRPLAIQLHIKGMSHYTSIRKNENTAIKVYPQPFSEAVYFDIPASLQVESIEIIDLTGQVIIKGLAGHIWMPQNTAPGIYYAVITLGSGNKVLQKLIYQ